MPTEVNSAALGSGLLSDFNCWLVMPISPRRYHPPNSSTGGGAYIGDGAMARSAANAVCDNNDTAPAAMTDLTLRMTSSLLAGEAQQSLTSKNPRPNDGSKCLSAA